MLAALVVAASEAAVVDVTQPTAAAAVEVVTAVKGTIIRDHLKQGET